MKAIASANIPVAVSAVPCAFTPPVDLLRRLRSKGLSADETEELRQAVLLSINGVAAGMQNTG